MTNSRNLAVDVLNPNDNFATANFIRKITPKFMLLSSFSIKVSFFYITA
jgi:hypothetical protein